jgi:hypothetical protein
MMADAEFDEAFNNAWINGDEIDARGDDRKKAAKRALRSLSVHRANLQATDVNEYTSAKTVSQGLMDVALLSANTTILVNLWNRSKSKAEGADDPDYFLLLNVFVFLSMILQLVAFGVFGKVYFMKLKEDKWETGNGNENKKILLWSNRGTILVGIITFLQVIITGFGTSLEESPMDSTASR